MHRTALIRGAERIRQYPAGGTTYRALRRIGVLERLVPSTVTVTVAGEELSFRTTTPKEVRLAKAMESDELLADLMSELRPEDVFFDVGAAVGYITCTAALVADGADVFAFEPHPENAARIRENLRLNGLEAVVEERALSSESGEFELAMRASESGSTHNHLGAAEESGKADTMAATVPVEVVPGDVLVRDGECPQPTVVKIDVEGKEYSVLDGMRETLASPACRLVYCEVHKRELLDYAHAEHSEAEVRDLLVELGFDVERTIEGKRCYQLRCTKP